MLHIVTRYQLRKLLHWLISILNLCLATSIVWHIPGVLVVKGGSPSKPFDLDAEKMEDKGR